MTDTAETVSGGELSRISPKRTLLELLILILSGAGMTLAFAPVKLGIMAWVCVIPLIWLCAKRTKKRAFFYGLVWGYMWHVTGTFFLREIMFFIPFVFAVVLGLFNAVFAAFIPAVCRNLLYPAEIRRSDFETREKFFHYPVSGEILATFTLASIWVLLEYMRSHIFTGFPWNLLGVSQWKSFALIQICEYTGVYGVSFLVILTNIAGYFAIHGLRHSLPEGKYKRPFPLIIAILMVIFANAAGLNLYRAAVKNAKTQNMTEAFAVGVVQPHLSQRRAGTAPQSAEALSTCYRLSQELIQNEKLNIANQLQGGNSRSDQGSGLSDLDKAKYPLHLIIWPESAVPRTYYNQAHYEKILDNLKKQSVINPNAAASLQQLQKNPPFEYLYRKTVRSMMAEFPQASFLIGTLTFDPDGSHIYNSALLLQHAKQDPANYKYDYDTADVYSKVHLVPYGEFVPLAWKYPVLDKWMGLGRSLTPGSAFRPLTVKPGINAGVMICYEDVFAYTARELARNGANFLVVVTNDAWYPKSSEPEQHYINSIFRTIETRLPMVRAGNSDYSVLIDPFGRLTDSVFKQFASNGDVIFQPERKKSGSAKFIVPVPRRPVQTFYTRYGDMFVLLCGMIAAVGITFTLIKWFQFSQSILSKIDEERQRIRENFKKS